MEGKRDDSMYITGLDFKKEVFISASITRGIFSMAIDRKLIIVISYK